MIPEPNINSMLVVIDTALPSLSTIETCEVLGSSIDVPSATFASAYGLPARLRRHSLSTAMLSARR